MYDDTEKEAPGKKGGRHPCLETYNLSGGGIREIYRPRNERQNVTEKELYYNSFNSTRSRDNYGELERLHRKRECLGQALKEE